MYGALLNQPLNVCKSSILIFKSFLHYQTINFIVCRCKSTKIANIDNFSLLKTIDKNLEFRFKYMGSYPSDKVFASVRIPRK